MVWTSFYPKNNIIQLYYEFDFMVSMSKLRGYAPLLFGGEAVIATVRQRSLTTG